MFTPYVIITTLLKYGLYGLKILNTHEGYKVILFSQFKVLSLWPIEFIESFGFWSSPYLSRYHPSTKLGKSHLLSIELLGAYVLLSRIALPTYIRQFRRLKWIIENKIKITISVQRADPCYIKETLLDYNPLFLCCYCCLQARQRRPP